MSVLADVVWPGLFLGDRLTAIFTVAIGLVVEAIVLRWAFRMSWPKALMADIVMNAASTFVGAYATIAGGLAWEFGPARVIYPLLHVGTFNPLTWAVTCLIAVATNTLVEMAVLRVLFKVPFGFRAVGYLAGANAISVLVAYASLFVKPARP
jgi:hypothetical protein